MNENLPIKQSKNGQELPFKLGNYLVHLIYQNAKNEPNAKIICTMERLNLDLSSKPVHYVSYPPGRPYPNAPQQRQYPDQAQQ